MTHFQQGPRPDDAVLGGQSSAPPDAAVLGGIEGVKQQFEWGTIEQKKAALDQAVQYGEKGLDFLFEILDTESNYDIHLRAYNLLTHILKLQKDENFLNSFLKKNQSRKILSKVKIKRVDLYLEKYKEVV